MTGLEKVTGKILADAEADAREALDKAEAECAAIREKYAAATEAELEALREQNDRDCQAILIRARSSAAMAKRDAVLAARASILDDAYAAAAKQVRSMNGEQYLDLLCKMLRTALKDQLDGEEESMRLYGEDISPDAYEVILNSRDRESYGEKLMAAFGKGLGSRFPATALAKLRLAGETAAIDGGLILRAGAVETNCALSMLMAENRRKTEGKVNRILFGDAT